MKLNVRDQLQMRLRRVAVASLAIGAIAAETVHAGPPTSVVVVPCRDLSTLVQQTGEVMLLQETVEGGDAAPALNFEAIDTVLSYELNRMFDAKQLRAQMTLE